MTDCARREVEVLDLLTVIVMLEHCDPELTRVRWYTTRWEGKWSDLPILQPMTTCMRCLLLVCSPGANYELGRGVLIDKVKGGLMGVAMIDEPPPLWHCPRCNPLITDNMMIRSPR